MPVKQTPTARQLRLGAELRKLREHAGLSSTEAGQLLGTNQAQISNIEASRVGVSADRVRNMAHNYSCQDRALIESLADMAGERHRGWWEEYREILPTGLLDLAELEHHATALRVAHVIHIPGLLQTAHYARAICSEMVPHFAPHEVEHRVSYRIKRQVVVHRSSAVEYTAIIHEAALRMQFGGREATCEQLAHVIAMSEREGTTIRVIPFSKGTFPGSGQSIGYSVGPVPALDTVQLDTEHGSVLLDAQAQLEKYRFVLDRMETIALAPGKSRDLIRRTLHNL
ncbi:Scr1 family TA system antitoxin-like transcriptional regulator [Streptomyces sp. NPDC057654]|uniref:Scr1 family TA system antitoxin-like transcriptional regulator n=1 Tax=Streptomyces sp. NPDC057654 TaxID=3346196 RepID=UPI00369CEB20